MPEHLGAETGEVSVQIVSRVASLEETDPVDLPPLYDAVDPDALDALFARTESGTVRTGEVTFAYAGHDVTVHFDGTAVVTIE